MRGSNIVLVLVCSMVLFLGWTSGRLYNGIMFERDCGGHLKRAADANTVQLATQELKVAVDYLKVKQLTTGYTSIIYTTPDEDIGFWYSNLDSSLRELEQVKPDATQLERSNLLLKLRETLLDHSGQGETITAPCGISVYPLNIGYALLITLSLALFAACIVAIIVSPY